MPRCPLYQFCSFFTLFKKAKIISVNPSGVSESLEVGDKGFFKVGILDNVDNVDLITSIFCGKTKMPCSFQLLEYQWREGRFEPTASARQPPSVWRKATSMALFATYLRHILHLPSPHPPQISFLRFRLFHIRRFSPPIRHQFSCWIWPCIWQAQTPLNLAFSDPSYLDLATKQRVTTEVRKRPEFWVRSLFIRNVNRILYSPNMISCDSSWSKSLAPQTCRFNLVESLAGCSLS